MSQYQEDITRFLESLPIPAYLFAYRERRFVAANQLFRELVGYSEDDLLTQPWHTIVPHGDRAAAEAAVVAACAGEFPTHAIEWRFLTREGMVITGTARVRDTRIIDAKGKLTDTHFVALVSTSKDIVVRAEDAFGAGAAQS